MLQNNYKHFYSHENGRKQKYYRPKYRKVNSCRQKKKEARGECKSIRNIRESHLKSQFNSTLYDKIHQSKSLLSPHSKKKRLFRKSKGNREQSRGRSRSRLPQKIRDYRIIKKLGRGSSCAVYLVKCLRSSKFFALKVLNIRVLRAQNKMDHLKVTGQELIVTSE